MTHPRALDLELTRSILADLDPDSWDHVAATIAGVLAREPLRSGPGWERERVVLGALLTDLREAAREAGAPVREDPRVTVDGVTVDVGARNAVRAARGRAVAGRLAVLRELTEPEIEEEALAMLRAERETYNALVAQSSALAKPTDQVTPDTADDGASVSWI